MNYREAVEYIDALGHEILAMRPGLDRISRILERLGNPESAYPSVIVAGTNGKGSVAAMIESILLGAGIRAGLYTSPHLVRPEERIRIHGIAVSQEDFAAAASKVREAVEGLYARKEIASMPSFFEFISAMAFDYFRAKEVQIAILEVGLGGRLDATNAAPPFLTVVTSIDYDHEKHLGDTLEQIAGEKAATIKRGCRAVIAAHRPEVRKVMAERCRSTGTEPIWITPEGKSTALERRIDRDGHRSFDLVTTRGRLEGVTLGLRGAHQVQNAVAAAEACSELRLLGFTICEDDIRKGLAAVEWPGRLELLLPQGDDRRYVACASAGEFFGSPCLLDGDASSPSQWQREGPAILLDGAHNPAAAKALRAALREFEPEHVTLVFGAMQDKKIAAMANELFSVSELRVLTRVDDPRAADRSMLEPIAEPFGKLIWARSAEEAIKCAIRETPSDGLICVTGSLYLVGEAKRFFDLRVAIEANHNSQIKNHHSVCLP